MEKVSSDYQSFAIDNDGIVIVSKNPLINNQLGTNSKWGLFRISGETAVFADNESLPRLRKEGLPQNIIKFIQGFSGN